MSGKKDGFTDVEMGPLLGQASPTSSISPAAGVNGAIEKKPVTEKVMQEESSKSTFRGQVISSCMMYSCCSVGMILVNKSLASGYNHLIDGDLNILLVVFQSIIAVISVEFCKFMKWVDYPKFSLQTARQWAPVNILFSLMLFTGMASLQHNTVPMVTVFKNVTNIFITAGNLYFFSAVEGPLVFVAFGVMVLGALLAAWKDVYISFIGLFWMLANCLATAGYVLYLKYATKNIKLSKFGMVFYNNTLCTFFLLPAASMMGEVRVFINTPALHTIDYFLKNFAAGFVGFFLNFASLNCVSVAGPTTYAIIGSLNKIPTSIFGWILFDSTISSDTWFFISVSMFGGFIYSYSKIIDSGKKSATSSSK